MRQAWRQGIFSPQNLLRRRGFVGQAQFSDLKDKLRLASYAYMLGMEENVREHLIAARTRSLATSNLTLHEFFRVLEKACEEAPDAELWMSLARQSVKA